MTKNDFVFKLVINLLLWVLTIVVIVVLIPGVFVLFGDGIAKPKPIDFSVLADFRIFAAQVFAAFIGLGIAFFLDGVNIVAPPVPGVNQNPANPVVLLKTIPQLFQEEAFAICLNFGALSFVIALMLGQYYFFLSAALCYWTAHRLK